MRRSRAKCHDYTKKDHCEKCGESYPAFALDVDHITPIALGGTNTKENLWTLCAICHRDKTINEDQPALRKAGLGKRKRDYEEKLSEAYRKRDWWDKEIARLQSKIDNRDRPRPKKKHPWNKRQDPSTRYERVFNIRVPEKKHNEFSSYCSDLNISVSDVLRAYIDSLV